MKQLILNIATILIVCASASAQPDTLWTKTFGGFEIFDYGSSVQQTTDGGFIIAGCSFYMWPPDIYLIKTDAEGNQQWFRFFGGYADDYCNSVQQSSDGGYIIAGYTSSYGTGSTDVYLIKTDASGDSLWTKTLGGIGDDYGWSVQQTTDGGFIIAGSTESYGAGYDDVYLIKTDTSGNQQWYQTFGGSDDDWGRSVQQTIEGGYIIAGCTESFGVCSSVYLIKTDTYGDTLWTKTFGGSDDDGAYSVQQTADGDYIIAGSTESYGAGYEDVYLIKTDASGDSLWTKTLGGIGDDYGWSVQQTTDGGFIIAGSTESYGAGYEDVYLIKTDADGNQQWQQTFGGSSYDAGYSVQQTTDGGYIVAGSTGSYGAGGGSDVYLIKTEIDPILPVKSMQKSRVPEFTALHTPYPNPFNASTVISFELRVASEVSLIVYDIQGRKIQSLVTGHLSLGYHEVIWDAEDLSSGMYFVKLTVDSGQSMVRKVVLMK